MCSEGPEQKSSDYREMQSNFATKIGRADTEKPTDCDDGFRLPDPMLMNMLKAVSRSAIV